MGVRAKFKVTSITEVSGGAKEIKLYPVTSGSDENKEFFKYTPSGEIRLSVLNEAASKQFAVDQEFFIDFTPA
ncbi:hypothetical protein [Undibacterium sp. Ji22W]|uniref:hypothetical protein n=1 Tax=Undibacterium sp. Ji22W TaxID=3413038 RepID=UPI003BF21199